MTEEEIIAEVAYRMEERLGILCGSQEPTDYQRLLATLEVEEWEESVRSAQ